SGLAIRSGRANSAKRTSGAPKGVVTGVMAVGSGIPRRYHTGVVSPFMPDPEKIDAIRRGMPATASGIFLNAGSAGPMPAEVQKAIDDQAASELAVGRAKVEQFLAFTDRMDEARATIAAVLVADPDDIALT